MYAIFHPAPKVLVEITQRHTNVRSFVFSLYQRSTNLCNEHASSEGSSYIYAEKDNVISWTSKVSSLVKKNRPEQAIGLFKLMLMSDKRPNFVTILSVIRSFGPLDWEDLIGMIHGLVIKMGFESELSVLTALLGSYSMYSMEIAWKLFDHMPATKDVVLWSAMIGACVKNGRYMEAIECFREMQFHDVEANHVSIVSILPACGGLGALWVGKQIHCFMIKRMFYRLTNIQNSLADMYAKCKDLESSIRVFEGIPKKDIVSWKIMLRGCTENECPRKALDIFLEMRLSSIEPDEFIIQNTIAALVKVGETEFGLAFHCYALKSGFVAFISIRTALLQMYAKFDEVILARSLFDHMDQKDTIIWSKMISVHAQHGQACYAFDTFQEMLSMSEKPNEFTFVSLLQACSSLGSQELGESIHGHVIKAGYSSSAYLTSALIDLYCRVGRMKQGKAAFDEAPAKDLICWSSMINGYQLNGYGMEALQTFSNMLDNGVEPNDIVFLSVLSACSHCQLDYEGWSWFNSMTEKYGIAPKLAHYACMVDLLSRQGNIEEALEFVKKMPVEPDKRIWGALLAGCRLTHGPIEIAEFVVQQLSMLDPQNTSYHLILQDLYAEKCR